MINTISQFREAILNSGLEPPHSIEPGKMHRFPGLNKVKTDNAGWCILFKDGLGGSFGDWSTDFSDSWKANRSSNQQENAIFRAQIVEAKFQANIEREKHQNIAATKALQIWNNLTLAQNNHTYLIRKGIKAHGVRVSRNSLVIPISKDKKLCSLQFIRVNGDKQFLSGGLIQGCSFIIGSIENASVVCIAEGFATGATIHEATGYPVVVAFNAGNLVQVAEIIRKHFAQVTIVICADDDAETQSNPGIKKATEAKNLVNGLIAVPDFGNNRPPKFSDFNDMAKHRGLDAVSQLIKDVVSTTLQENLLKLSAWSDPQSLTNNLHSEDYPVDALPTLIREAVLEVQSIAQAPCALVAASALSSVSLICQSHINVKRAEKLQGPSSLFLLTIADSGERKSTCDNFFTEVIREYEQKIIEKMHPEIEQYKNQLDAWSATRDGILAAIKEQTKKGNNTTKLRAELANISFEKPTEPKIPRLLLGDETQENLAWTLSKKWPSAGIVSSEAGLIFGSHSMNSDSIMRNLSFLNVMWDGGVHNVGRRSSESFNVKDVRLTIGLQVQVATLQNFFGKSGALVRGTGFLARFLIAHPQSTQGTRFFKEPSVTWNGLTAFNQRLEEILNQPIAFTSEGGLAPVLVTLSTEAKKAWIHFHDVIEKELGNNGELFDVRDVASKTADNAARLAAIFQMFSHGISPISLENFENASRIVAWHLHEARRFFNEIALPENVSNALKLQTWLVNYCTPKNVLSVSHRDIMRNVIPSALRSQKLLEPALNELIENNHIQLITNGRRKDIYLNPALLVGGS